MTQFTFFGAVFTVDYAKMMDPAEVEFFAEKELIAIVPNFSQDKIYLIGVSITHSVWLNRFQVGDNKWLCLLLDGLGSSLSAGYFYSISGIPLITLC